MMKKLHFFMIFCICVDFPKISGQFPPNNNNSSTSTFYEFNPFLSNARQNFYQNEKTWNGFQYWDKDAYNDVQSVENRKLFEDEEDVRNESLWGAGVEEVGTSGRRDPKENVTYFKKLDLFGPRLWSNYTIYNPLGFIVVAPSIIQPSSIYQAVVWVSSLQDNPKLGSYLGERTVQDGVHFRLALFKNGADIQSTTCRIQPGSSDVLKIQVPMRLPKGEYKIRIEGDIGGSGGGSIFASETRLKFSEKFLSILIQSDRHVYNGGQKIMFRVISLQRNLSPYTDPVDIYILDPRGFIMRRWPSVPSYLGVVDISYELPPFTALGSWTIRVDAGAQREEKRVLVERYFPSQHEIYVTMDPFILSTEEELVATVASTYGTEKTVRGNATVKLYATEWWGHYGTTAPGQRPSQQKYTLIDVQSFFLEGSEEMRWPMSIIYGGLGGGGGVGGGVGVRVEAQVTEYFLDETRFGFAESRIIKETIRLKFIENAPKIFKPGMPFQTILSVGFEDLERVPREVLEKSTLRVTPQAYTSSGGRVDLEPIEITPWKDGAFLGENEIYRYEEESGPEEEDTHRYDQFNWKEGAEFVRTKDYLLRSQIYKRRQERFLQDGIVQVKFIVPQRTTRLTIHAEYWDEQGGRAGADLVATPALSFNNVGNGKYINVALREGDRISVSSFVVLQFSANFKLERFHYVVLAKGLILSHATEELPTTWSFPRAFTVVVSPEMVPGFQVFVYVSLKSGEVLSDSIFVPVQNYQRQRVSILVNGAKDRSKDSVELQLYADPAAYFGVSAQRSARHVMQAGNELSHSYVLQTLHSLEPQNRTLLKWVWRDRSGAKSDQVNYFPSMSYAIDTYSNLEQCSLILFTDGFITMSPTMGTECVGWDELRCLTGGNRCYLQSQACDGIQNCDDGTDELNCELQSDEDIVSFRIHRTNRFGDFFDANVDWGWRHDWIAHSGDKIFMIETPETTDSWYFTGFAVSKQNGFALLGEPIEYGTDRPFMMVVDYASKIRRGEQVGIIAMLYNKLPREMLVLVSISGSDDYVFVQAGKHGQLEYDDKEYPMFTSGEHQHMIWMGPQSERELRIPIKALIEQGTISVTITATTQIRSDTEICEIEVTPEGGSVGKHTSLLVDMTNRAVVLKYFNIFVEELPWVPYEYKRKYIYGSPAAHVTVSGDIIGPLANSLPVSMLSLMGKDGKGTGDRIFELSANVWALHYLRLTNQLTPSISRPVFTRLNQIYAWIMKRFHPSGYFKMWNVSRASVWLTSWALQTFLHASFQDWENHFYVQQEIFLYSTRWLLQWQQEDGSFSETDYYERSPINKKMGFMKNMEGAGPNVTLTAHLVITLHHVTPMITLDGDLRRKCNNAKQNAIKFLERSLSQIKNPYQIAITAYALTLADSREKEAAFYALHVARTDTGEFVYWSPGPVPTNALRYENNRPFLEPKNNEFWDSVAVEGSSYALLVYLIREGVSTIPERTVAWLNTMRLTDGVFISTVDSAVAFQALTEYANRARIRNITDMSIKIEVSSEGENGEPFEFRPDSAYSTKTVDISKVWGHVNILGRGAGQAVVQLDVSYGVDWDEYKDTPPQDAFELNIREFFSDRRNKSDLTIEACFKWILTSESEWSGGAVLEVEIPSGYGMLQSDALRIVSSGVHDWLKDAWSTAGRTSWFFERIPSWWSCFNHTVKRWYPVANLTRHYQATIYEAYSPERFVNTLYEDTTLMTLDICQVCGSYQCPYCPFYNQGNSQHLSFNFSVIFFNLAVSIFCKQFFSNSIGCS